MQGKKGMREKPEGDRAYVSLPMYAAGSDPKEVCLAVTSTGIF